VARTTERHQLREVYAATHPAAKLGKTPAMAAARAAQAAGAEAVELLTALANEAEDEDEDEPADG
jgi:hypothetical protein